MMSAEKNILVRIVEVVDFPAIQAIKPTLTKEKFDQRLALQNQGKAEFLVVEADQELVCFVFLKWFGKSTHPEYPDLEDLYTKQSARSHGYASLLVQECEKRAQAKGFSKIGLAANPDPNCPAQLLYAKLGYTHDGQAEYVDGVYDGVEDWCVDLEKELG